MFKNPATHKQAQAVSKAIQEKNPDLRSNDLAAAITAELKQMGYDGVIRQPVNIPDEYQGQTVFGRKLADTPGEYVVFDKWQISSQKERGGD